MSLAVAFKALAAEKMAEEMPLVEVALRLDVDVSTVSHYLRGDYPSEDARNAAAEILREVPPFSLWVWLFRELGEDVTVEVLKWLADWDAEVLRDEEKCILCGKCTDRCRFDRCVGCGECVRVCPVNARELIVNSDRYRFRMSPSDR